MKKTLLSLALILALLVALPPAHAEKSTLNALPGKAEIPLQWSLLSGEAPPFPTVEVDPDSITFSGVSAWGVPESEQVEWLYTFNEYYGDTFTATEVKTPDQVRININVQKWLADRLSFSLNVKGSSPISDVTLAIRRDDVRMPWRMEIILSLKSGSIHLLPENEFALYYEKSNWSISAYYDAAGKLLHAYLNQDKLKDNKTYVNWTYSRLSMAAPYYGLTNVCVYTYSKKNINSDLVSRVVWTPARGWYTVGTYAPAKAPKGVDPQKPPFTVKDAPQLPTLPASEGLECFAEITDHSTVPALLHSALPTLPQVERQPLADDTVRLTIRGLEAWGISAEELHAWVYSEEDFLWQAAEGGEAGALTLLLTQEALEWYPSFDGEGQGSVAGVTITLCPEGLYSISAITPSGAAYTRNLYDALHVEYLLDDFRWLDATYDINGLLEEYRVSWASDEKYCNADFSLDQARGARENTPVLYMAYINATQYYGRPTYGWTRRVNGEWVFCPKPEELVNIPAVPIAQ